MKQLRQVIKDTEKEITLLESKENKTKEDYRRINILKVQIAYVEKNLL